MSLFLLLPGADHGRRVCAHIDEIYASKEEVEKMKVVYVESYYHQHGVITTPLYVPEAMNEILSKMMFGSFVVAMDLNTARQKALPGTVVLECEDIPDEILHPLYTLYCGRLDVSRYVHTLNEPEFSMVAQLMVKQYTTVIDNILESLAVQTLTTHIDEINIIEQHVTDMDILFADHEHFQHQLEAVHSKQMAEYQASLLAGNTDTLSEENSELDGDTVSPNQDSVIH